MTRRPHNQFLFLDHDRQEAIDRARAAPVHARVMWDFDADAWALECATCGIGPTRMRTSTHPGLTDADIKAVLLRNAERHNREKHGGQ